MESFNNANITFAPHMIPHHRQVIEMTQPADDRAASDQVRELAADIEAAQDPEIETTTDLPDAWGEDVPEDMCGDMGGMDHDGTVSGTGNAASSGSRVLATYQANQRRSW